ncbi:MAG: cytochrome c oxidase subunit 3 [Gammaproteobacteria bacterium]|nr:cytochrome c oxidase subunit 3 [Gammaproteobacteria bacterium]
MYIQESIKTKYPPGDLALWIFICAELLVFAIFFAAYAFTRASNIELFNQYQTTLNTDLALLNTIALLTSSYFVVSAIISIKENKQKQSTRFLFLSIIGGFAFLIMKMAEYSHHMSEGINLTTNLFYMFYLSLTFFHFMHVILGIMVLIILWLNTRKGLYTADNHGGLVSGGAYWHMVDLVWLILFPLIYIMR